MNTVRHLVLENKLGQRVRSFRLEASQLIVIYRLDTRRVEAHGELASLDADGVEYQVLKKVAASTLDKGALTLIGLGKIRLANLSDAPVSPTYTLSEEQDRDELPLLLKKTAIGHVAVVAALIGLSFALSYFTQKVEEPQLVTIVLPKEEPKQVIEPRQKVQVSQKKIVEHKEIKKIANKTVIKPVTKSVKTVAKKMPTPVVRKQLTVVRAEKQQNLQNVGALAALGGVKNGTKGYEGLDTNSLKNIRSAGVGSGGGGVGGSGAGGLKGVLPGQGLIAGSAGSGARAEGAGGYGTKGFGGGRAGYGKISLVGNTAGISLPLDEEASVEGGLDRDQIQAVINKHQGDILYCYEKGLQGKADLRGRVPIEFVIGGNGRVTTAKVVQSTLDSKLTESCMVAKLRSWQFPRPVGRVDVNVTYPFNLTRVSSR